MDWEGVRQSFADRDPIQKSELADTITPLKTYLTIYNKAQHECYINYMEGAKILAEWLGPLELVKYSKIPRIHRSYETQELGKILSSSNPNFAEDCIYHTSAIMQGYR